MAYKSWSADRTIVSTLNITVKTHKEEGNVSCRDIQANEFDKMGGLSRWLSCELRKRVKTLDHVLRDSADLVTRLKNVVFPESTLVQTADIEHFFMSGTPKQIQDDIRSFLESEINPDDPPR